MYREQPEKFGREPSDVGRRAERFFAEYGTRDVLDLGCGGGRDALYFASCAYVVVALDASLRTHVHDARSSLPFDDERFDAVFGHMFYTMALDDDDLEALFDETYRVLRPRGLLERRVRTRAIFTRRRW